MEPFYVDFYVNDDCGGDGSISVTIYWSSNSPHGMGVDSGSAAVPLATSYNINTKTFSYAGPPVAIPDDDGGGVDMYLDVNGMAMISDLEFIINGSSCSSTPGSPTVGLDHASVHDLVLTLYSPQGTVVTLMERPGDEKHHEPEQQHSCGSRDELYGRGAVKSAGKS